MTNQGKLLTKHKVPTLICGSLIAYLGYSLKSMAQKYFLLQNLLIAILCVKMSRVNKAHSNVACCCNCCKY